MKIELAKTEVIHFIGIGGIGMSGLSLVMKGKDFKVQGSDVTFNKNIERLKKSQPWRLISSPRLNDKQIAPKKKSIVRFWTLVSLIIGSFYSFFLERKKDIIYSEITLKKIIPFLQQSRTLKIKFYPLMHLFGVVLNTMVGYRQS